MCLSVQCSVCRRCWLIFHRAGISVLTKLLINIADHHGAQAAVFFTVILIPHCHTEAGLNIVLPTPPPSYLSGLLQPTASSWILPLAARQSADHCICLSAEYQLINAFTATINKTAERLLSLIEKYSSGCIEPNEKDVYYGDMWNHRRVCVF